MDDIKLLMTPLPGVRLFPGEEAKEPEPGSIIAFRKGGDECLYASGGEEERGLAWIPVGEFSVDPEAVTPPEFVDDPSHLPAEDLQADDGKKPGRTPFGRKRPELGGE